MPSQIDRRAISLGEFLGKKLRCIRAWFTSHWHNTSLDLASALDVAWISHFPHDLDQGWPVYVAFMQLVFFSRLTSVCSSLQSHWLGAVLPVDYRKYRTMSCVLSESIAINLAVLLSYCSSNLERKREEYEIHFCMTEILIYRWYYGGMYVSCRAKCKVTGHHFHCVSFLPQPPSKWDSMSHQENVVARVVCLANWGNIDSDDVSRFVFCDFRWEVKLGISDCIGQSNYDSLSSRPNMDSHEFN